jgi:hypothetical protein
MVVVTYRHHRHPIAGLWLRKLGAGGTGRGSDGLGRRLRLGWRLWWRLECRLGWRLRRRLWWRLGWALECRLEWLGWRRLRFDAVGLAVLTLV